MNGTLTTTNYKTFVVRGPDGTSLATFEGAQKVPKGMPGDTVAWDESKRVWKVERRAAYPPITGILELSSKTKYGMTSRGIPLYLFTPCHKQWPMMIVGCSHRDVSQNQLAVVQFSEWTTTGFPRANLTRLLGPCGSADAEQEALFLTYNPFKLNKELLALEPTVQEPGIQREDTPPLTFNIDPVGCKDIDDVISLYFDEAKHSYELWITIADVAAYIPESSELDRAAFQQGSTAYKNGEAVRPMLPRQFSENYCSLLPGTERLGVSLVLQYTNGRYTTPSSKRWCLSRVHNRYQFNYNTFVEEAQVCQIPIDVLQTIASAILGEDTDDPHKWVEAFMLTYNLEAAKILREKRQGLLRKHEMADLEKLALYEVWGGKALAVLANRAAKYCQAYDDAPQHWGLKATVYCHASSPIRRYADLANQRILKAHITYQNAPVQVYNTEWLNQRQKDLKSFERDMFLVNILLQSRKKTMALVIERVTYTEGRYTTKCKLWLPEWNRVVTWKTSMDIPAGVQPAVWIELGWFANPAKRFWKESVIFKFEKLLEFKSQ